MTHPNQQPQSDIERAIISEARSHSEILGGKLALESMVDHRENISNDFSGSPLEDYLTPEDAQTCRDMITFANANLVQTKDGSRWPGSQDVNMQVKFSGGVMWRGADTNQPHILSKLPLMPHIAKTTKMEKNGLLFAKPLKTIYEDEGYSLGNMMIEGKASRLVLCREDGLLRCDRNMAAFPVSRAKGYGKLPKLNPQERPIKLPTLVKTLKSQAAPHIR